MNSLPHIEFLGHAAFALQARDETTLVIDPYPPGALGGALGLAPIDGAYDLAVSSHAHSDHDGADALAGPPATVISGTHGPFSIERIPSQHDEYEGRRRGGEVDLLSIRFDGVHVVHASDIGRSPHPDTIDRVRGADMLLVPVGGYYTVGAAQAWEWALRCSPSTIVPMHYRAQTGTLPIRSVAPFLAVASWPIVHVGGRSALGRDDHVGSVVVLERKESDLHLISDGLAARPSEP